MTAVRIVTIFILLKSNYPSTSKIHEDSPPQVKMMKEWFCIYFVCILISPTISNEQEYEGGFVNGQQVGKCVAGFCLPFEYQKLETPFAEAANQISIEADIMDVLMVRTQNNNIFSLSLDKKFV